MNPLAEAASLIAAIGLAGCGAAFGNVADADVRFPTRAANRPFPFLYMTPAFTTPGHESASGVLAAVWPDGRIVRASSEADCGKSYVKGYLSPAQVRQVRTQLKQSGILDMGTDTPVLVDARAVGLGVRSGRAVRNWAYSPDFPQRHPGHPDPGPAIEAVQRELFSLTIADAVPEPAGRWANYPSEWLE